ncbi:MAG: coenzyme synthetase, partial [Bradymonadaceae bacterium]
RQLMEAPYYRDLFREHGLSPNDLASVTDLPAFPILDRATLGDEWREIAVVDEEARAWRDAAVVKSSGTTGDPISVVRDGYDLVHMWTMVRFWATVYEVDLPDRPVVVLLCDLPGGLEYSSKLPTFGDGHLYRISTRQPRTLERLVEAEPDVLFSDPAGFHWLADRSASLDPRIVLSSAQYLAPSLRDRTESRLEAPLVNYYSTSETGPVAWECSANTGHFHVLVPDVWVESVAGEVTVTRLRPSQFPLLRYQPGDAGRVEFEDCRCGYRGWSIVEFECRRVCEFVRPDGETVDAWQLARLFKHRSLGQFRVTQSASSAFRIELVDGDDVRESAALHDELAAALERLGWSDVAITVDTVSELTSSGGKPQPFRCDVEADTSDR